MGLSKDRSKRKITGGLYGKRYARKKKISERVGYPKLTKFGERKLKKERVRGGNLKHCLLSVDFVNLYDPKTKKHSKVKILKVLENPANRHYARRNILTKGTIIETEKGRARIISRPGQEGSLNAVLI